MARRTGASSVAFRLTATSVALISAACAFRRPPAEWKSPIFTGQQWKLPNGLNVVAEHDLQASTVSMALVIGAGAADDPPGKEGLAHLVEHLALESRPQGQRTLDGILDFDGDALQANALTEHDLTTFFADAPRESLPVLVEVARDIVSWPLANVDPAHFPIELSTVRAELDERLEPDPSERIKEWSWEALFPRTHPYARLVGGTPQSLASLSFEDAVAFARSHYRPNNATLVFTGGVDAKQLGPLLERAFRGQAAADRAPPIRAQRADAAAPHPPEREVTHHQAHIHEPELRILWSLPSDYGPGGGNMAVLVSYLNLVLDQIRSKESNIASASVVDAPGALATTVAVIATLHDATKAETTAEFLIDHLADAAAEASRPEVFFAEPPKWVGASAILATENPTSRALKLAQHAQLVGQPLGLYGWFSDLMHPSTLLLRRWLGLLTQERARTLIVEPVEGRGTSADWLPPVNPAPQRDPSESLPPLSEVDLLGHLPDLSAAQSRMLPNGLAVEIVPIRGAPTSTAMLVFPGGSAVGPAGASLLLEAWGLESSADQVPAFYDGGMFSDSFAQDRLSVYIRGQPQNVRRQLDWLAQWVTERRVPGKPFLAAFREGLPRLRRLEAQDEVRALVRHAQALYPGSGWGQLPTSDQLAALTTSDLQQWEKAIISPSGAVLVVTGDFDATGTLAWVERAFGDWQGEARRDPPNPEPPASHAPTLIINPAAGARVAQVLFSCRLPPARTSRQALMTQLSAYTLKEALFRAWRTESGQVYSVSAAPRVYWGGAAEFSLQVTVPNERLAGILEGLHEAIGEHRSTVVEQHDFERAKQAWVRDRDLAFRTSRGAADEIATSRLEGGSLPELVSEGITVADVALKELEQTLSTCSMTAVLSVTGEEGRVRTALSGSPWNGQAEKR